MYIHTSIDVAWICRSRCRNISEILEVAMSFHPESIPIPEVAVRLTAYITELMSVGIKRVCFDSHIWDTMIECEKCHWDWKGLLEALIPSLLMMIGPYARDPCGKRGQVVLVVLR